MPKKFIKRYMPDHEKIRKNKQLNKVFGTLLHDPNLLHLNRRSVSMAFFVGLFVAFVPLPSQMIMAAAIAILIRCNLPISVGLVWVSNPITMPPLFYFAYKVGAWILSTPEHEFVFELSWKWLGTELEAIWQPFLLGCTISGVVFGALGYITIRLLWRLHIINTIKERKKKRALKKAQK
ncbi:MAG: DUF2062 domain-containing protein [Gammaproteobacteria bacterium]|nr:DUF2062 domain-containing protein [Gammaproteobacteria bacterium]